MVRIHQGDVQWSCAAAPGAAALSLLLTFCGSKIMLHVNTASTGNRNRML